MSEPSQSMDKLPTTRKPARRGFIKRDAQRERTQQDLRAAGRRIFAQGGYTNCSVEDIAREAGATRSTFYLHYDSKQSLLTDIVLSDLIWQERRYAALVGKRIPTKKRLLEWFETFETGFRAGYEALNISRLAQAINPDINKHFAAKRLEFAMMLGRQVPALRIFDPDGNMDIRRRGQLYLLMNELEQLSLLAAQGDPAVDSASAFADLAERYRAFMAPP